MKHLYSLLAILLLGAMPAAAQSYEYLTFQETDGTEASLAIDNLKITFSDGTLLAENGSEQTSYAISALNKMYFSTTATGITSAANQASDLSVSIKNGKLVVEGATDQAVSIYSLDGRQVARQGLTSGVYIVRVGNQAFKVLAR